MVTVFADTLLDNGAKSLAFTRSCLLVHLKAQHHQTYIRCCFVKRWWPLVKATEFFSLRNFKFLRVNSAARMVMAHAFEDIC